MFARIKSLFSNPVYTNLFHIGVIKMVNILAKYFLTTYLIRKLGEDSYGIVTWIDSVIQYLVVFINFGFDIYIAKNVVENQNNSSKINEIVSSVYYLKGLFFILSFLFLGIFILVTGSQSYLFYFYLLLLVGVGEVFFPIWYFQGVQKMRYLSGIALLSKGFLIGATFFWVNNPSDAVIYLYILVISAFIYGFLGLYYLKKVSGFQFIRINHKTLWQYFKAGYLFFFGRISTMFMHFGTVILIGYFFNASTVSGFDVASKIIFVFVFGYEILQQAFFPVIVKSQNHKQLNNLLLFTVISGTFVAILLYYFAPEAMEFIGGLEMVKYAFLLQELVVLIPIIGVSILLGSCGLVAFGFSKAYNYSLMVASGLYIIGMFLLYQLDSLTLANVMYIRIGVDVVMAITILWFSIKNKVLILKR